MFSVTFLLYCIVLHFSGVLPDVLRIAWNVPPMGDVCPGMGAAGVVLLPHARNKKGVVFCRAFQNVANATEIS